MKTLNPKCVLAKLMWVRNLGFFKRTYFRFQIDYSVDPFWNVTKKTKKQILTAIVAWVFLDYCIAFARLTNDSDLPIWIYKKQKHVILKTRSFSAKSSCLWVKNILSIYANLFALVMPKENSNNHFKASTPSENFVCQ